MKTDYSQALPESWMDKANMFRALADEHRQRLVMTFDGRESLPESWMDKANLFRALADEHRQRLVMTFDRGERLTVGQLANASTLSQSTVSHHLKELWKAAVLIREKQGKEVYYRVDTPVVIEKLQSVIDYAREHMMKDGPEGRLTVGQLASASTLSQSTVSHHLKELWKAGVLIREKQGKEVYYRVDTAGVIAKIQAVIDYAKESM